MICAYCLKNQYNITYIILCYIKEHAVFNPDIKFWCDLTNTLYHFLLFSLFSFSLWRCVNICDKMNGHREGLCMKEAKSRRLRSLLITPQILRVMWILCKRLIAWNVRCDFSWISWTLAASHPLLEFPSTGKSVTIQCLQTFIAETGSDKVIKLQCFSPSVCVCQLFVCACACQSLSVCYVYVNHDVISVCVGGCTFLYTTSTETRRQCLGVFGISLPYSLMTGYLTDAELHWCRQGPVILSSLLEDRCVWPCLDFRCL